STSFRAQTGECREPPARGVARLVARGTSRSRMVLLNTAPEEAVARVPPEQTLAYATQVAFAIWGEDQGQRVQHEVSRQNVIPFAERNDPDGLPWFSLTMIAIDSIFICDRSWRSVQQRIASTWRTARAKSAQAPVPEQTAPEDPDPSPEFELAARV